MHHHYLVQPAGKQHIDALVSLEANCFDTDRLTRRNFQWMLSKGNARTFIATDKQDNTVGYLIILFHRGTSLARVYSMAVADEHRRRGIGRSLMQAADNAAAEQNCAYTRLEVRKDNATAIHFYTKLNYLPFETWPHYYEDDTDALRFEKRVPIEAPPNSKNVPYYKQTTEFTCGPASLMMALAALNPTYQPTPAEELQIWREATTIFMTSGHGGCGPRGLALAAHLRGYTPEIYLSREGVLFLDGVRSESKKQVLKRVHADFKQRIKQAQITTHRKALNLKDLANTLNNRGLALVLISSYRLYGEKSPHWVLVTGINQDFVFIHDPSIDEKDHQSDTDRMNIPIRIADFTQMAQFGQRQLKAAITIKRGK